MRRVLALFLLLSAGIAGAAGEGGAAGAGAAAALFDARCADCHGRDGRARTAMGRKLGAADLTQTKLDANAIASAVKGGRGKMTAPALDATAEQQQALTEYVKSLREMLESVDTSGVLEK